MGMLATPSTTAVTHVTSSMDGTTNERKRRNVGAKTTVSASASTTINSTATIDVTTVLHLVTLLHTRARNHSASTASESSHPDCDKPTSQVASAQRASRRTTG